MLIGVYEIKSPRQVHSSWTEIQIRQPHQTFVVMTDIGGASDELQGPDNRWQLDRRPG